MSSDQGRAAAIVVAAGTGSRFGRAGGKQLAPVAGKPLVQWALESVLAVAGLDPVVLVCHPEHVEKFRELAGALDSGGRVTVVRGGATRGASVRHGLEQVPHAAETIVVHDGARPLAEPALFERVIALLRSSGADGVIAAVPSVDTLKAVRGGRVAETLDRTLVWAAQTPQAFSTSVLREAHASAERDGFEGTDDAALVERIGGTVLVHEAPRTNIKVTTPEDLVLVEGLLASGRSVGGTQA